MRATLEALVRHEAALPAESRAAIVRYAKLLWIHTGPYHSLTARKFVIDVPREAFTAAVARRRRGRRALAAARRRDGRRAGRSAGAGAVRRGVRADGDEQEPAGRAGHPHRQRQQPVRRRHARRSRRLHRALRAELAAGEDRRPAWSRRSTASAAATTPPSAASSAISRTRSRWRRRPCAEALRALVRFYRTGDDRGSPRLRHRLGRRRDSPVDTINGFIEVYLDARGCKGAWEAVVSYVNEDKTPAVPGDRRRGAVVRGPDAVGSEVPQADRDRRVGAGHRRGRRSRRLGADDADRHQSAQRPGDPRGLRQQVGVALEHLRGLQQVDAGVAARGVLVVAGRGGAGRAVGRLRRRALDQPARDHRPRLRARSSPSGSTAARRPPAGAVLDPRGDARRSGGALLRRRSADGGARPGRGRRSPRHRARRVRGLRAQRASCSCAASARAPPSRRTTCATARRSCTG